MLILLILAGMWAAVLLPPYLRNRSDAGTSISSFRQHLSVLERATPVGSTASGYLPPRPSGTSLQPLETTGPLAMPLTRQAARKRRRDLVTGLGATAAVTLLLAVVTGTASAWALHVLVDLLLAGYVYLLVQAQQLASEREVKVRYLPSRVAAPAPALALRRAAR